MRYHYQKPDIYLSMYGELYICNHPVYDRCTLFTIALLDVSSMHPHSAIAEVLFGPRFTKAFLDIVEGRVSIKHEAWDIVNTMLVVYLADGTKVVYDDMAKRAKMLAA